MDVEVTLWKSLVCTYCERRWPVNDAYETCPACREPTEGNRYHTPNVTDEGARELAVHYAFGWWLWENDRL